MVFNSKIQSSENLKLISIVAFFVLILTIIFGTFFQSIPFFSEIQIGLFIIFIASLLLHVIVYYKMMSIEEKMEAAMDFWEKYKKKCNLEVDTCFDQVEGEKIIAPLTTCFIQAESAYQWKHYARDVIVTNKRILVGFVTNAFIVRKETFGQMNLWNPNIEKVPISSTLTCFLGGNSKIGKISYESQDGHSFVKIEIDYAIPNSIMIYHPKSAEIYKIFQKIRD